jgi:hypothetical protein
MGPEVATAAGRRQNRRTSGRMTKLSSSKVAVPWHSKVVEPSSSKSKGPPNQCITHEVHSRVHLPQSIVKCPSKLWPGQLELHSSNT